MPACVDAQVESCDNRVSAYFVEGCAVKDGQEKKILRVQMRRAKILIEHSNSSKRKLKSTSLSEHLLRFVTSCGAVALRSTLPRPWRAEEAAAAAFALNSGPQIRRHRTA